MGSNNNINNNNYKKVPSPLGTPPVSAIQTSVVLSESSVESDLRYKCCCQLCHVYTGAAIVGLCEVAIIIVGVLCSFVQYSTRSDTWTNQDVFILTLLISLIWALIIFLAFYGIRTLKSKPLLPHMICQVFTLIVTGLAIIFLTINVTLGGSLMTYVVNQNEKLKKVDVNVMCAIKLMRDNFFDMEMVFLVLLLVLFSVQVWFFLIMQNCYKYLKDREYQKIFRQHTDSSTVTWKTGFEL